MATYIPGMVIGLVLGLLALMMMITGSYRFPLIDAIPVLNMLNTPRGFSMVVLVLALILLMTSGFGSGMSGFTNIEKVSHDE